VGSPMSQASEISPEAVADGVFSVSLLSPARCRSVLDSVQDENHWEAAPIRKSVAGENRTVVEKNARNAESLGPNSHPRLLDEFEVVVKEQLLPFASRISGVQVRDVRGTQLVRYRPGGYYHPHTDTTPSYFRTRYLPSSVTSMRISRGAQPASHCSIARSLQSLVGLSCSRQTTCTGRIRFARARSTYS